jgi:hypothetical protein
MNETPAAATTTASVKLPDLSSTMANISNKKPSIIISSNRAAQINNNDLNHMLDQPITDQVITDFFKNNICDINMNYLNAFDSGISGRQTIINDGKSNDNDQFSKRLGKNFSKEE